MRASLFGVSRVVPSLGFRLFLRLRLGVVFVLIVALSGCLGRSPAVTHYVLGGAFGNASIPEIPEQSATETATGISATGAIGLAREAAIRVGPVQLPAYLERPQVASMGEGGQVELAEFERWLGGFEQNFLRAIALDLAGRLGSVKVVAAPSQAPFPIDYSIRIHVDDLIAGTDGRLVARIRWALVPAGAHRSGGQAGQKSPARLFLLEETVPIVGNSAAAIVEAHEAVVTDLSRRIAEAIAR